MQLKLFIVPVKNMDAAEQEMNAFLRGQRVLAVKKEFVADGENSFWTFCVEYQEPAGGMGAARAGDGRGAKVDYKELLSAGDFALFCRLREWRKAAAEKDAIPVYAVLSNEQLAQIARRRPATFAELRETDGLGEAKSQRYGEAVLQSIAAFASDPPATGEAVP